MVITIINIETQRAELIKKINEFGFEVGLKNHSEIGWVIRDLNALMEGAHKLGIKSPDLYYQDGKIKGRASRDKGDEVKAPEKNADIMKKVTISDINNQPGEIEDFGVLFSLRKPRLNDLPNLVKQAGNIEMPGLIGGFKPHGSSRFGQRKKS